MADIQGSWLRRVWLVARTLVHNQDLSLLPSPSINHTSYSTIHFIRIHLWPQPFTDGSPFMDIHGWGLSTGRVQQSLAGSKNIEVCWKQVKTGIKVSTSVVLACLLAYFPWRPRFLFVTGLPLSLVFGLAVGLAIGGAVSTGGEVTVDFKCKLRDVLVRSRVFN